MLITKALLLYKVFPSSVIIGGSGLFLFLKTTSYKPSPFTFTSSNQLSNPEESRIFNKLDEDPNILIREFHPTFNEREAQNFLKEEIGIHASNDSNTLSIFDFVVHKAETTSKTYEEIFSASIYKHHLDKTLLCKKNPHILLTFLFKVKGDLLTSQSGPVDEAEKTITLHHLVDTKLLMESNQNVFDSSTIKIKDLELNLALHIHNFSNTDTIHIALVNKKTPQELVSSISKTAFERTHNPLEDISFQYLEASLFYRSPHLNGDVETHIPTINKADLFQSNQDPFILPNINFNNIEAISKNWISPTFSLGGFVEDREPKKPNSKFYIKKGNDTTNYKVFNDPKDVLTAQLPESIFTTTENNPGLYGGYIADTLSETQRPAKTTKKPKLKADKTIKDPVNLRYDNRWTECINQAPVKTLCEHHDVYFGTQTNMGSVFLFLDAKYKETYITRRSYDDLTNKTLTFDEPTPAQGIHPFIARKLLGAEEKYKDTGWKLPTLAKQYRQAILEQSTKPIKSKDYKALIEGIKDKDKNITFPAYFLRTSHFWEQEIDSYSTKTPAPTHHYSTNHQLAMQIHLDDWQKFLLDNDQFGTSNIPSKDDPTLRTGFNITTPITVEFQDTSFNSNINKRFDVSVFVNLESLKHNNEFTYTYSLIHSQHTHYQRSFFYTPDDYKRETEYSGLELISKLVIKVFLDDKNNINITYDFPLEKFLQHVKTICDFRDFDREQAIKHAILADCPNYYKLPALFGVTIHETPTIAPYWYVNGSTTEMMRDYLGKDKLAVRDMAKTEFLTGIDRQTRVVINLKPNKSKEVDVVEQYVSTSNWFLTNYDRYVSFFNYSITQKKKNKEGTYVEHKPWIKEHVTEFEALGSTEGKSLLLGLESPDTTSAALIINSKHPFSTKLSVWTNKSFQLGNDDEKTKTSFDKQNYETEEKDQLPHEIYSKYAAPFEISIDPTLISTDKDKPTWVSVRMALNTNAAKTYKELKEPLEAIFTYMCKNDLEIAASDIKTCVEGTKKITNWNAKDAGLQSLTNKDYSFSFLNYGFFISKEVTDGKTTFFIKSKLWGASFANRVNTKQEVRDYGAEGSAGMRLTHLRIAKTLEASKAPQAIVTKE